jgi:serine/threonine protein kinase
MASLDDYHLGQVIAVGSFGAEIRYGRYKSDRTLHVSIKCVSKQSLVRRGRRSPSLARLYGLAVVREQRLLKQFSGNQCVPKLYACFHNTDFVVTVTQCCTGGSLQEVIASLLVGAGTAATTTTTTTIFPHWREHCAIQMFDILVFLHTSSIVHCDLSPSVLHLTADGNLRLVDLGYAVDLKQTNRLAIRPQTPYSAPELWHDNNDNTNNDNNADQAVTATVVSTAVDLWSAGCICFAMHTASSPFAVTSSSSSSSPCSTAAAPVVDVAQEKEEGMKPAARIDDNNDDDAVEDVEEVGKRIAAFTKEYNESTKKHPQLLNRLPLDSPSSNKSSLMSMSSWRETIYELLHPDPLQRTQAAAMDTTGNLYDAMRSRFLLPTAATATTTVFRPPVPHWLREEEGSSGDESNNDTTKSE